MYYLARKVHDFGNPSSLQNSRQKFTPVVKVKRRKSRVNKIALDLILVVIVVVVVIVDYCCCCCNC